MAQGVEISKSIGKKVRKLRKIREWTLHDLADLVGVSWTYLGALERGEKRWPDERIEQVASVFHISPGLLLDPHVDVDRISEISIILEGLERMSPEQVKVIMDMIDALSTSRD